MSSSATIYSSCTNLPHLIAQEFSALAGDRAGKEGQLLDEHVEAFTKQRKSESSISPSFKLEPCRLIRKNSQILIIQGNDKSTSVLCCVSASLQKQILIFKRAAHQNSELSTLIRKPTCKLVQLGIRWISAIVLTFDRNDRT